MTGLDALTKLVESYLSRRRTRRARNVAAGALAPLIAALRRLAVDLQDGEARAGEAYGALASHTAAVGPCWASCWPAPVFTAAAIRGRLSAARQRALVARVLLGS